VLVTGSTGAAMERPFFIAWLLAIVVVSVPVTLVMLLDMFKPAIVGRDHRHVVTWSVAIVAAVAISGYLVGVHNARIMTCADFAIAGSAEPQSCAD
jgi:hypothetical protein